MAARLQFLANTLRIGVTLGLLGVAMIHLYWEAPYRAFLMSQGFAEPWVQSLLGMTWEQYAQSQTVEARITLFQHGMGIAYLGFAACAALTAWFRWCRYAMPAASACLLVLALCYYRESHFQVAMFTEYTGQVMAPFFLFAFLRKASVSPLLHNSLKLVIGITFLSHGLYAIGVYPVPGNFVNMVMEILGLSESSAFLFLRIAGYLDILLAIAIFVPRLAAPALLYAAAWGALTALARPSYQFALGATDLTNLSYWLAEFLCRVPHIALPLAAIVIQNKDSVASIQRSDMNT